MSSTDKAPTNATSKSTWNNPIQLNMCSKQDQHQETLRCKKVIAQMYKEIVRIKVRLTKWSISVSAICSYIK